MSPSLRSLDPALQEVLEWINRRRVQNESLPDFVPLTEVTEYFKNNTTLLKQAIKASFGGKESRPQLPSIADGFACIFCILISIGKGHFIDLFQTHDLNDARLPFYDCPQSFPNDPGDDSFFGTFRDHQWRFCAPILQQRSHTRRYTSNDILPYLDKQEIPGATGAGSTVYKVHIHADHDRLVAHREDANANNAPARFYALKTYRGENARTLHDAEFSAFRKLKFGRDLPNLIEFYKSYHIGDSYSVLLEYADGGTLEQYMQSQQEPRAGWDIVTFWKSFLALLAPLATLHSYREWADESEETRYMLGCHQDIKPTNILVKSRPGASQYNVIFKLADLGISDFRELTSRHQMQDHRGTQTYGAPETYRKDATEMRTRLPFLPHADMWSFGCVLSEVVVWVIHGYSSNDGLKGYRSRREAHQPNFSPADCFHDGDEVISAVTTEMSTALRQKRQYDSVTQAIVNMVEQMLEKDPELRPTAKQCRRTEDKLMEQARKDLRDNLVAENTSSKVKKSNPTKPTRSRTHDPSTSGPSTQGRGSEWPVFAKTQSDSVEAELRSKGLTAEPDSSDESAEDNRPSRTAEKISDGQAGGQAQPITVVQGDKKAASQPPVHLSYTGAMKWREQVKKGNKFAQLPDHNFTEDLENRDHVFIIDDSATMKPHLRTPETGDDRPDVERLLKILAYIAKQFDPDGVDVHFMINRQNNLEASRSTDDMITSLRKCTFKGTADFGACLKSHLAAYSDRLDQHHQRTPTKPRRFSLLSRQAKPLRPITFYVLTNGVWTNSDYYGQDHIKNMSEKLQELRHSKGEVGIQFISFGKDTNGLARLRKLDELNKDMHLPLDIVDTEPSTGSIWKMLLGSINPCFDADEPP